MSLRHELEGSKRVSSTGEGRDGKGKEWETGWKRGRRGEKEQEKEAGEGEGGGGGGRHRII
eukprot:759926-Hanusia_phi.AAC.3